MGVLLGSLPAIGSAQSNGCFGDLDGNSMVDLSDLLLLLTNYGNTCTNPSESFPSVQISEIHYNPSSEQGNDSDWEFLELYNPSNEPICLEGWRLTSAIEKIFADSDSIGGQDVLVIARNADSLLTVLSPDARITEWNAGGSLNNTGETIELRFPDQSLCDQVAYEDNDGWVAEPDGNGPSLEWFDPGLPNESPDSWTFSLVMGGSPGQLNTMWGLSDLE